MEEYLGTAQTVASQIKDVHTWIEGRFPEIVAVRSRAKAILDTSQLPVNDTTMGQLKKLVDVLEQCNSILIRCHSLTSSCIRLGTDERADSLRDSISRENLDIAVVKQFIDEFQKKMKQIEQIREEYDDIDCNGALEIAKEEVGKLEETEKSLQNTKKETESTRIVARAGAVALGVAALIAPVIVPIVVGAAVWLGSEENARDLLRTIARVLPLLKELKEMFVALHHGIVLSQTDMHKMVEWYSRADGDRDLLTRALQDPDFPKKYRVHAIADGLSHLLNSLSET
ncbi:uncharacterized protein LOC134197958 [Corticium candelabrum]|uniref:uncharacterized protein LOC134197958 n=1 Tax=Corticium candelabrum TaxID=121492 RepID=UPI002E259DB1|nr:uncharacterized protein LOC134197958 [Corticium candelabrum]